MDDSSDFEFDNLLKNVKSTCKKKARSKNSSILGKLHRSCPQKKFEYQTNAGKSRLKFDEDETPETPKQDCWIIENGHSAAFKTKTPKLNTRLLLLSSDDDDDFVETESGKVTFTKGNGISASPKWPKHDNNEYEKSQTLHTIQVSPCQTPRENLALRFNDDLLIEEVSEKMDNFKTPKKKLTVIISSDDSSDDILELSNSIHCTVLKDNGEIKSAPRQFSLTSSKKTGSQRRKVSSPNTSDDEKFNQSYGLLNKRPLNKGGLDCIYVASTPTANCNVPGLRDGYFSSTSRKKSKRSIKFLVSCLDDSIIEPDSAFNSFQQNKDPNKENVTQNIPLDYSKPVPIRSYTKAGVNDFLAALSPESGIYNYDSRKFVSSFEAHKIYLTNVLYYFFNKFVFDDQLPKNLTIDWKSSLTSSAGNCECKYFRGTTIRYCSINLSVKLLNSADKVRDTLIHELCHAAVHLISEERDAHGPFWRFWYVQDENSEPSLSKLATDHTMPLI